MERPSSRQNRVPPALRCSAFLPSSARGSHKNQRAPPGRLSHTSGQVCPGCGISDIREAIALLPPEGMTWLLKRASRACLRRAEACRQPIREVMKRRCSIGTARMPTTSCPSLPQQCHVPPLCGFPGFRCGEASLASWRRCTRDCHAPQPFLPALRQDASLGSPSAKESKTANHWTKPLRDIQLHAMARTHLDSVMSSRYESSIEHAFVFTGRPKLLAAETA